MRQPVIMITGAAGEIGHTLITRLSDAGIAEIITLDLKPLEGEISKRVSRAYTGSILDQDVLDAILAEFEVDTIYHLAALLSTRSEFTPLTAHQVNVDGTLSLLEFAQAQGRSHGRSVRFFYPSSIAAFGFKTLAQKEAAGRVCEDDANRPITMYGCNKLYCEQLGRYYTHYYKQLDADTCCRVDFRGIRFPGLISAFTVPSGGTSDFVPEMIHSAAQQKAYACFVRADARIPFMTMPDAVDAIFGLMDAEQHLLTRTTYNITAFNPSAEEVRDLIASRFPQAEVSWSVDGKRQAIIDSWPADVDDSAARTDWGFAPRHDLLTAFDEYLLPNIRARYAL